MKILDERDKKEIKDELGKLSSEIAQLKESGTGGSGVTTAQANSLWTIMQKTAFTEPLTDAELNAFKTAWGIETGGEDEPVEPDNPEITLTNISVTYTGGDVTVGTSVNDLSGITVTATYSDGSTATITDYTLSGTIAEGSNTITVSYGGKTTTFAVTGVAESGGEVSDILYELPQAMTFDGTNGFSTTAMLNDVDKDYSIVMDFEYDGANYGKCIIDGVKGSTGIGTKVNTSLSAGYYKINTFCNGSNVGTQTNGIITNIGLQRVKIVIVRTASDNNGYIDTFANGKRDKNIKFECINAFQSNDYVVKIAPTFIGTINDLKIYNKALSTEEIEAYLA